MVFTTFSKITVISRRGLGWHKKWVLLWRIETGFLRLCKPKIMTTRLLHRARIELRPLVVLGSADPVFASLAPITMVVFTAKAVVSGLHQSYKHLRHASLRLSLPHSTDIIWNTVPEDVNPNCVHIYISLWSCHTYTFEAASTDFLLPKIYFLKYCQRIYKTSNKHMNLQNYKRFTWNYAILHQKYIFKLKSLWYS